MVTECRCILKHVAYMFDIISIPTSYILIEAKYIIKKTIELITSEVYPIFFHQNPFYTKNLV